MINRYFSHETASDYIAMGNISLQLCIIRSMLKMWNVEKFYGLRVGPLLRSVVFFD